MSLAQKSPSAVTHDGPDLAFTFVQALASELSGGKIELPGFPHIVMRVQKILGDENSDASRIVKVLGSEPVLASQIVRLANSAALNPAGARVTDLRAAVVEGIARALASAGETVTAGLVEEILADHVHIGDVGKMPADRVVVEVVQHGVLPRSLTLAYEGKGVALAVRQRAELWWAAEGFTTEQIGVRGAGEPGISPAALSIKMMTAPADEGSLAERQELVRRELVAAVEHAVEKAEAVVRARLARKAAERAAREQIVPGAPAGILYEDKEGHWHEELSAGNDRPETEVKG